MDKWKGKVAVVTGVSSIGIGREIVKKLVEHGVNVVGLARRVERVEVKSSCLILPWWNVCKLLQELANDLKSAAGKVYAFKCDVSSQQSVKSAFAWIEENVGGVSILVNNAGVYKFAALLQWLRVIDSTKYFQIHQNSWWGWPNQRWFKGNGRR